MAMGSPNFLFEPLILIFRSALSPAGRPKLGVHKCEKAIASPVGAGLSADETPFDTYSAVVVHVRRIGGAANAVPDKETRAFGTDEGRAVQIRVKR